MRLLVGRSRPFDRMLQRLQSPTAVLRVGKVSEMRTESETVTRGLLLQPVADRRSP